MASSVSGRRLPQLIRSLHIWLSMFGFGVTFLFAVTGFTLNHAEWFERDTPAITRAEGSLPVEFVDSGEVGRLEVAEQLRAAHRLRGRVSEFDIGDDAIAVRWRTAGYTAEAEISRRDGSYQVEVARFGVMAILDDLHRGQHCGAWWSAIVDAGAVLLTLMSITGLWLLLYLTKRLKTGVLLGFLGGATVAISYVFTVR